MKLQFDDNDYYLMDGNDTIATTDKIMIKVDGSVKKLSKENCDEIFGVTDVKDIRKSVNTGVYLGSTISNTLISIATEQSLLQQPTEIEVEIEMEIKQQLVNGYRNQPENIIGFIAEYENISVPKLDENGCLILKKK